MKKRKKSNSNVFKVIGIITLIAATIIIVLFSQKNSDSNIKTDEIIKTPSPCLTVNLKISEINPNTNMLKISRDVGKGDLYEIKISVNGNPLNNLLASDIKGGSTKIFIINVELGDKVEIAPVLKDGTICSVSDTKIA